MVTSLLAAVLFTAVFLGPIGNARASQGMGATLTVTLLDDQGRPLKCMITLPRSLDLDAFQLGQPLYLFKNAQNRSDTYAAVFEQVGGGVSFVAEDRVKQNLQALLPLLGLEDAAGQKLVWLVSQAALANAGPAGGNTANQELIRILKALADHSGQNLEFRQRGGQKLLFPNSQMRMDFHNALLRGLQSRTEAIGIGVNLLKPLASVVGGQAGGRDPAMSTGLRLALARLQAELELLQAMISRLTSRRNELLAGGAGWLTVIDALVVPQPIMEKIIGPGRPVPAANLGAIFQYYVYHLYDSNRPWQKSDKMALHLRQALAAATAASELRRQGTRGQALGRLEEVYRANLNQAARLGFRGGPAPAAAQVGDELGMSFVLVQAGAFYRQRPGGGEERVAINQPFFIQTTEVTRAQWKAVMKTEPWQGKPHVKPGCEQCPAVYISFADAQAMVRRLNRNKGREVYRLPSAEQWEYACRAGSRGNYCFGSDPAMLGQYAWFNPKVATWGHGPYHHIGDHSRPVAGKGPNPWGLYDMHGNVWEWCQPASGSAGVVKGGSWVRGPGLATCGYQKAGPPGKVWGDVGFRLVRIAPGP